MSNLLAKFLQREFARLVTGVERLKTAQPASLAERDARFTNLQHRAFRGELLTMASIQTLSEGQIEALAKVLGECASGTDHH